MPSNGLLEQRQIGFLAADPVQRKAGDDTVVSFRVITNEYWTDNASGERRERAEGFSYELWGKSGDAFMKHMKKGARVYVEAEPRNDSYESDKRETVYVVRLRVRRWLNLERPDLGGGEGSEARD